MIFGYFLWWPIIFGVFSPEIIENNPRFLDSIRAEDRP